MNKNGSKSLKIIKKLSKSREPSHQNDANGSKSHKMNVIIKIERTQSPK